MCSLPGLSSRSNTYSGLQEEEPNTRSMATHPGSRQDSGMTMIAVLLCTLVRGTKLQEGKVGILDSYLSLCTTA